MLAVEREEAPPHISKTVILATIQPHGEYHVYLASDHPEPGMRIYVLGHTDHSRSPVDFTGEELAWFANWFITEEQKREGGFAEYDLPEEVWDTPANR